MKAGGFTDSPTDVMRKQTLDFERSLYETTASLDIPETVMTIAMRDGYESETRVFKPVSAPEAGSPLVVLIYGGGFVVGTSLQLVPFARAIAKAYGATVVAVSYRLAPECPFPAAPNDVWDSLKWVAANATSLGADPSQGFVVGGVSAGGNLTCVAAQKAVKEKLSPPLTGIWVCIPVTTVTVEGLPEKYRDDWVSRTQNADALILSTADIDFLRDAYEPDAASEDFSPFVYPDVAADIPPAFIQVAGMDPMRDDALIYRRYLQEHGVKTRLNVYPGVPHSHHTLLPTLESSQNFRRDVVLGFGWLLGHELTADEVDEVAGAALDLCH
ncbi:hypothetical protein P175DRAFT_0444776 [Aspergillus ochraceoroseus IBT 24754]|nr:uncharacterized protein P175DRAFT_0444776 [Aspergillus ochraceoroseus IBT 24754]PTU17989.1 hypothetical protein P175DRAFT_0444776 [Aspergillus ochraceoroseus IBT 24754]